METPLNHLSYQAWPTRSNELPNSTRTPSVPITFDLPILGSNEVLDEVWSTTLKAVIATREEAMARIESRICDLKKELGQLQSRWDEMYEELWFAKALVSPVRKIPPEILGEIFAQCVETNLEPIAYQSKDAPLLLTTVCRRWRQVALDTPILWTNITISESTTIIKPSFISKWMWNSRPRTLNVFIELDENDAGHKFPEVFNMIFEEYYRIDRLVVYCSESIGKHLFRPGERYSMPNLCALSVRFPLSHKPSDPEWKHNPPIIETPRLNSLESGHGAAFLLHSIKPTSNIRRIKIAGKYENSLLTEFLRVCSGLEEIHATSVSTDLEPIDPISPILLPSLWSLTFYSCYITPMLFDTPALRYLSWSDVSRHESANAILFGTFLLKIRSTLLELCLQLTTDNGNATIARKIGLLTELKTLKITSNPFFPLEGDAFWKALTPDQDAPVNSWPCPKLLNLSVSTAILDTSFAQFVERRTEESTDSEGYLRRVEIESCRLLDGEAIEKLGRTQDNIVIEIQNCFSGE